jgi:hypothetical protein
MDGAHRYDTGTHCVIGADDGYTGTGYHRLYLSGTLSVVV